MFELASFSKYTKSHNDIFLSFTHHLDDYDTVWSYNFKEHALFPSPPPSHEQMRTNKFFY